MVQEFLVHDSERNFIFRVDDQRHISNDILQNILQNFILVHDALATKIHEL